MWLLQGTLTMPRYSHHAEECENGQIVAKNDSMVLIGGGIHGSGDLLNHQGTPGSFPRFFPQSTQNHLYVKNCPFVSLLIISLLNIYKVLPNFCCTITIFDRKIYPSHTPHTLQKYFRRQTSTLYSYPTSTGIFRRRYQKFLLVIERYCALSYSDLVLYIICSLQTTDLQPFRAFNPVSHPTNPAPSSN